MTKFNYAYYTNFFFWKFHYSSERPTSSFFSTLLLQVLGDEMFHGSNLSGGIESAVEADVVGLSLGRVV